MKIICFCNKEKKDDCLIDKEYPKDWEFMRQSEKVLTNIPDTWKQYPDTEAGMVSIIDMEYAEMKKATTKEELCHELVHVASACLHLWRRLNNIKM